MQGMMMERPLRVIDILEYAAEVHPDAEVVSVRTEGGIVRGSYGSTLGRVARLAHALERLGVHFGDRVATLAWNGYRHFELYYAISGIGAVCHTINPRLSAEQMTYIIQHADDRLIFVDLSFVPLLEKLKAILPDGCRVVVLAERQNMPDTTLDLLCYEDLLEPEEPTYAWPEFDERTACGLCYTSGTTGEPKGALYSHRSTILHALFIAISMPRILQESKRGLPVVPLFHVNAWGLPYSSTLTGSSLIFPGGKLDGASLFQLMDEERVTSAWGVPTVWLGLLGEIEKQGRIPAGFEHVIIGGSAAPRPMIETFERLGVTVNHAWGMTEMSPVGTQGNMPDRWQDRPFDELIDQKAKQGRRLFGVDLKIVDEEGRRQPHDGTAVGELYVRGNTVISGYFANPEASAKAFDGEGWFGTGDVAAIDGAGFLQICDRSKDLIKSGGEWISSIDLESAAMAHPGVANCAVIAVPHEKWDERPLLIVVPAGEEAEPPKAELMELMGKTFAKWQLPDDIVFVKELPLTATGKVSKLTLRKQFEGYQLPSVAAE